MKIKITTDYVIEIDSDVEEVPAMDPLASVAKKHLLMAAAVTAFESLHQQLLVQSPDVLKAEVISVEEYVPDGV